MNGFIYTWWKHETVAEQLKVFHRIGWCLSMSWLYPTAQISTLRRFYLPVLKKLGLEYSKDDNVDIMQLCTLAVTGTAGAGDPA